MPHWKIVAYCFSLDLTRVRIILCPIIVEQESGDSTTFLVEILKTCFKKKYTCIRIFRLMMNGVKI